MGRAAFIATVSSVFVLSALACIWDYDTLAMERERFPEILELITGKFLRHSPEFYAWRVEDREARLRDEPNNLELMDDLGAAYDKLGEHQKAVDLMLKKEALSPGLYTTQANLGTFCIHGGQLEKGLEHIEAAITINPDAHFGREIYQKLLVEYVLDCRAKGNMGLPLQTYETWPNTFSWFVLEKRAQSGWSEKEKKEEIARALKGVLGMMRFGDHDSPILLEALGDLLDPQFQGYHDGPQRLRARAYLKASYAVEDQQIAQLYRNMARTALETQSATVGHIKAMELNDLESWLAEELKEAEAWYAQVMADEKAWIAAGINVDEAFSQKYYTVPMMADHEPTPIPKPGLPLGAVLFRLLFPGAIALAILAWVISFRRRRKTTGAA